MFRFLTVALAVSIITPSWAQEASFSKISEGISSPTALFNPKPLLWGGKDKEDVITSIRNVPADIFSRGFGKLIKTMLMTPVSLDTVKDIQSVADVQDVTAARLQKLLDLGAFDDANRIVTLIADSDIDSVPLASAIANTHLALGQMGAACLDLLSFESLKRENLAELDPIYKNLINTCSEDARYITPDIRRVLTLEDVKSLSPLALSIGLHKGRIDTDRQASSTTFKNLTPYAQATLMKNDGFPIDVKIEHLGYALARDIITPKQARTILSNKYKIDMTLEDTGTPDAQEILASLNGTNTNQWLPKLEELRYQTLSDAQQKDLLTKLATIALVNDPYDLLSYAGRDSNQRFGFDSLNYNDLKDRKAYVAALVQALSDVPPVGNGSTITTSESPWVLLVLTGLIELTTQDLTLWAQKNLDMLTPISPELPHRLALIFPALEKKNSKLGTIFTDYVNKKSLTLSRNYVMHRDDVLLYAKEMANDEPLGLLASQLAQVSNNESMDQIDPVIVAEMMRILMSAGLKETAHDIAIESLANITPVKDAEMGNKQTKEN